MGKDGQGWTRREPAGSTKWLLQVRQFSEVSPARGGYRGVRVALMDPRCGQEDTQGRGTEGCQNRASGGKVNCLV